MKIKSLLSLITLGVGVGALGLTSVVSSNASKKSTGEVEAADIGESHGWYLRGSKVGWDAGVPLQYDSDGFYSATVELTQADINEGKNQFKLYYSYADSGDSPWKNFEALNIEYVNVDKANQIELQTEGGDNSIIKTPGTYKLYYINNSGKQTFFWLENTEKEKTTEKIYLATDLKLNGGKTGGNYLYAYNNEDTVHPLGVYPGTSIERLSQTSFLSVSNSLNYHDDGGLFEIDPSLFHSVNKFILVRSEDGKDKVTESATMYYAPGWKHYYSSFQTVADEGHTINGMPELYDSATLAFDLTEAINSTAEVNSNASNSYHSVCNLTDKTQLKGLIDKYEALVDGGKTAFDNSTYWTYGSGEGAESTNTDITLAQLMNQINLNYAKTTNSVMCLGGNSSNNATLAVAGISAATIIASASMIILRRHKHKKA
ncbi:MAG: hypothetical protein MR467_06600 [Bacillales bacterium]|nr:hypothetical protein [Bacillales bacterium]